MNGRRSIRTLFALVACVALMTPAAAFGLGTGDDPRPTNDVLSAEEARAKAAEDARFREWLGSRTAVARPGSTRQSRVRPAVVDAPYYYMWTPSHAQERSYWCGPATVQIVADYWGAHATQSAIAGYMGTGPGGTDFSRVDDALRYLTGKSYYYYGSLSTESAFMSHVGYGIVTKHYPMVADVHIHASVWPNYVYDHSGHIIPLEAYDGRYGTIRINDPYNEGSWVSGGGATFGHVTYGHQVIWNGVYNHFRRAVVR